MSTASFRRKNLDRTSDLSDIPVSAAKGYRLMTVEVAVGGVLLDGEVCRISTSGSAVSVGPFYILVNACGLSLSNAVSSRRRSVPAGWFARHGDHCARG